MTKKNQFIAPVIVLILVIAGLVTVLLFLLPSPIQYIYEGDGSSSDDDTVVWNFVGGDSIWNEIVGEYEDIIYVHQDGANSTGGESWENAFTDLPSAIARAEATEYWTTLILVGRGIWDMANPITQLIDRNIILIGAHRDSTVFVNYYPSASSVFTINRDFQGYRFSVMLGDTVDGIVVEDDLGSAEKARVILNSIRIHTNGTTVGSPGGLEIGNMVSGGCYRKLLFTGRSHGPNTIGINISGSRYNNFECIIIENFATGILIEGNSSDSNIFHDIEVANATLGIDIDNGNNQDFHHFTFRDVVTQIDDEVGDSSWSEIEPENMDATISPDNLVGIVVDTGAVADTYGANVLIHDQIGFDNPYFVLAILFEPDVGEKYGMRLSDDNGATYFFASLMEAKFANQVERYVFALERIFNAHTRIWCSVKSESGGDDMDVWLEILEI